MDAAAFPTWLAKTLHGIFPHHCFFNSVACGGGAEFRFLWSYLAGVSFKRVVMSFQLVLHRNLPNCNEQTVY